MGLVSRRFLGPVSSSCFWGGLPAGLSPSGASEPASDKRLPRPPRRLGKRRALARAPGARDSLASAWRLLEVACLLSRRTRLWASQNQRKFCAACRSRAYCFPLLGNRASTRPLVPACPRPASALTAMLLGNRSSSILPRSSAAASQCPRCTVWGWERPCRGRASAYASCSRFRGRSR